MAKKSSISPRLTAEYPHLNSPDTKFKEEGEYHFKGRTSLDDPGAIKLREEIDALAAKTLKEAQAEHKRKLAEESNPAKKKKLAKESPKLCEDMPYSIDEDEGTITFSFKSKASGKKKETGEAWTRTLPLYDAKGNVLPKDAKIGGGSVLKAAYHAEGFYTPKLGAGVTLRLDAVQVLDLKQYVRDASAFGFESEDGYSAEGDDETPSGSVFEGLDETDDEGEEPEDDETPADDF
jgi:hypothetical protein